MNMEMEKAKRGKNGERVGGKEREGLQQKH